MIDLKFDTEGRLERVKGVTTKEGFKKQIEELREVLNGDKM